MVSEFDGDGLQNGTALTRTKGDYIRFQKSSAWILAVNLFDHIRAYFHLRIPGTHKSTSLETPLSAVLGMHDSQRSSESYDQKIKFTTDSVAPSL